MARIVALALLLIAAAPAAGVEPTDERVDAAMARMREYFYAIQDPQTGGWPLDKYARTTDAGGDTAIITLALLVSGESAQEPRLARAVAYLRGLGLQGTYARALRAHVWAQLPELYRADLEADADWLLAAADDASRFGYTTPAQGAAVNHSTTHYGVLGVWEAGKRGVRVPGTFWRGVQAHFLSAQRPGGGWGYTAGSPAYGSMTAAGLTALLIAQEQAHRDRMKPDPQLAEGIASGLAWLDERFEGAQNPGNSGWTWYYLYAIERVALASGLRRLNGQDWFEEGARHILQRQLAGDDPASAGSIDGNPIDTAFALLFLARGRVPVWATKLSLPDQPWNDRPNDLYFLTDYLSDLSEGELNWQTLGVDDDVDDWLVAPLAYLSSDEPLRLTAAQKANLKRYLDRGGTLLFNADGGSQPFAQSVRELAAELYPDRPMRRLPPEHSLFSALHPVEARTSQTVSGVSNGVRELMLLPDRDWGFMFQSDTTPGERTPWKLAANLWMIVTDRGLWPNRLAAQPVRRERGEASGTVTVGRARYDGNWLPEPSAWETIATHLFNRTGVELETADVELERVGESDLPLIHLAGVGAAKLTDEQLAAIDAYARGGGTLLVETVGGRGDFARSIEPRLVALFDAPVTPMLGEEPILSGDGLDHGRDARRVGYRRYTAVTMSPGDRPRLSAIQLDDRPAVIFSREDLSAGAVGASHWGISGYTPDSARDLLMNLVLWAAER